MVTQYIIFNNNYWILYLKYMRFMICNLSMNKVSEWLDEQM